MWKCKVCPFMETTDEITSTSKGTTNITKVSFTCQSHHVIYLLQCKKCHNKICQRITNHKFDIFKKLNKRVSNHYNSDCKLQHIKVIIIASAARDVTSYIISESAWICQLCTTTPSGLNLV